MLGHRNVNLSPIDDAFRLSLGAICWLQRGKKSNVQDTSLQCHAQSTSGRVLSSTLYNACMAASIVLASTAPSGAGEGH
jgi:hypothetical protein